MKHKDEEYEDNPKGMLERFIDGFMHYAVLSLLTFIGVILLTSLFTLIVCTLLLFCPLP